MDLQLLLNKWKIKADINTLLNKWNESNRHYHNLNHLTFLFEEIDNLFLKDERDYEKLRLVALFHDIVYDASKKNNEEMSAEFFINLCEEKDNKDIIEIKNAILETKDHKSSSKLSEMFNVLDMKIVEQDFSKLVDWEKGISEEYLPFYDVKDYKKGRIMFLESLLDTYNNNAENLLKLIDWVRCNY